MEVPPQVAELELFLTILLDLPEPRGWNRAKTNNVMRRRPWGDPRLEYVRDDEDVGPVTTKTLFQCVECGKFTTGCVPARGKGDLSFRYPRKHKDADGEYCAGNDEEAAWVDADVDGRGRIIHLHDPRHGFETGEYVPTIQSYRTVLPVRLY